MTVTALFVFEILVVVLLATFGNLIINLRRQVRTLQYVTAAILVRKITPNSEAALDELLDEVEDFAGGLRS